MSSGLEDGMEGLSMQALENLATGRKKKDAADAAFKEGKFAEGVYRVWVSLTCCMTERGIFCVTW